MNYIIFDLEATCDEERTIENEIIEIGAVKVNEKVEIVDTFNRFVKPILNPILTDFCKNLTKIKQENVDNADGFKKVSEEFEQWIGKDYVLCSWGFYDKKQLNHDSRLHSLDTSWFNCHISLKHQHPAILDELKKGTTKRTRPMGLGKALREEGLVFEGTPHRGIDDARNISKIFVKHLSKWKF